MPLLSQMKAVAFGLLLLITSFFGTLCVNGVLLPVFLVSPGYYRQFFDIGIGLWQWQVAFLLEKFIGMDVDICGDEIKPGDQSIIIMNHRTCFDWMYFWSVLIRQAGVRAEKIILKSSLRGVPGAGWGMQAAGYLFIKRKWEEDKSHLTMMIEYLAGVKYKTHILIFPEGTDFSARSKKKSDEYAAKNNLEPFNNILHPRTTGFTFLVTQLQKYWKDVTIYDVTIAYSSEFPQNEMDLIKGSLPGKVHFHIKRFSPSEIPRKEDELATWCQERWIYKEKLLKYFYKFLLFPEQMDRMSLRNSSANLQNFILDMKLYIVMMSWLGLVVAAVIACMRWPFVLLYFVFQVLVFLGLGLKGSGFEVVQALYYNRFFSHSEKCD